MKKHIATVMYIEPLQRTSVQGRAAYTYITPGGEAVNAGRSFAKDVGKVHNFPANADGTSIVTKLSRMVDNPWYGKEPSNVNDGLPEHYHVGADWMNQVTRLVKDHQITKQLELEVRFNKPEGFLTDKKNLHYDIRSRNKTAEPNYLETFKAIFYDRTNRFDDTTLRSALIMELARVAKRIAPTKNEANPSKHDFYIGVEDQAVVEKNYKQDIINDAITDLTLLRRNHTGFVRYQIAIVLGLVKGMVSEATLKGAFNNYITLNSKDQMNNIEKFNEIITMLAEGRKGLEKLWIKYLLKQAVNVNVMGIKSGHYLWYSKKGIDNLFDLGSNETKVYKLIYDEFIKYGEEDVVENLYKDLLEELKYKGVKTDE